MPLPDWLKPRWCQAALITGVGVLVTVPGVGQSGLSSSEGFRALPAWEALGARTSGSLGASLHPWLITTLFEQPYLRKPPGMIWAIGLSSAVLGPTEFAARFVSVIATILAGLAAWWFARRWFGSGPAVIAGLLLILTPVLWMPARSAEIEALHNLFALLSCLFILDRVLPRPTGNASAEADAAPVAHAGGLSIAALAAAFGAMLLTKGPAALPIVLCAPLGAALALRSARPLREPGVWAGLVLGGLVFGAYLLAVRVLVAQGGIVAVTQEPSEFLWNMQRLWRILTLPVGVGAASLPTSIAIPVVLWWWLRRQPGVAGAPGQIAAALALTFVLASCAFVLLGVGNTRYLMPASMLTPIVAAAAAQHLLASGDPLHAKAARWLWLRFPRRWLLVLLIGALAHAAWFEVRRDTRTSGEASGLRLAAALPDNATIYADQSIDTRPEVFWYARRAMLAEGKHLRVVWRPVWIHGVSLPPPGSFIALRDDDRDKFGRELAEFEAAGLSDRLVPVFDDRVHVFQLRVYKVAENASEYPTVFLTEFPRLSGRTVLAATRVEPPDPIFARFLLDWLVKLD